MVEFSYTNGVCSMTVWVEIRKSDHMHDGNDWEFGTCLSIPFRNRAGHYSSTAILLLSDARSCLPADFQSQSEG